METFVPEITEEKVIEEDQGDFQQIPSDAWKYNSFRDLLEFAIKISSKVIDFFKKLIA